MRKASPPITENTTVVTMTIRPSAKDRPNEPQISPTACCSNRSENQCVETPFIGKVNPPCVPWNDRIAIVIVGPYRNSRNSPKKAART